MENSKILVVDDDDGHRSMLGTMLKAWGFSVKTVTDGDEAINLVRDQPFDLILSDVRMARVNGLEALREIISFNPALPVILMTAYSSVETAVEALRAGAHDYLIKPLDFDLLKKTITEAIEQSRQTIKNRELRRQLSDNQENRTMVGNSLPVKNMLAFVETVAPTDATVLITGESGTGKELVAHAIHSGSKRCDKPLVTVNCAALAESLLESELFGHEKGAFTGADKKREGRFVQANGGTLFLDEIGEIPLSLQAKLLRALQQGEIQRVGSDHPITVDVRIIAATNRDLRKEAREKRFREDLYFRLNVISIESPPLRARNGDIPLLAAFFLQRFSEKNGKKINGFSPRAMDALLRYQWPGNVRELENAVERAVILCTGELISETELPLNIVNAPEKPQPSSKTEGLALDGLSLDMVEKQVIESTLKLVGENKSEAARRLGITRATLHNKLRKYGLE